ncbi:hypothetical protein P9112_005517 [Eukaryota sp. TZLM1-RC]
MILTTVLQADTFATPVCDICVSSDDAYAVVGSGSTAKILNIDLSTPVTALSHPSSVSSISLSRDNTRLCSSSSRFCHYYDVTTASELRRLSSSMSRLSCSRFFSHRSLLVSGDVAGGVYLYDPRRHASTPIQTFSVSDSVSAISSHQFGHSTFLCGASNGDAYLYDLRNCAVKKDELGAKLLNVSQSPCFYYYSFISNKSVGIVDCLDGSCLKLIEVDNSKINQRLGLSIIRNGDCLVYSDRSGKVFIYDLLIDDVIDCVDVENGPVSAISLCNSNSNEFILVGSFSGSVYQCDLR